jgi:hypothetical protein
MAFIGHLFAIVFGVFLASLVAGIAIALGIFGPDWHSLSGDIGERVYFWGTVFIASSFTGAMGFLPMVVLITLAESFKIRSLLVHLAAGAALLLLGYFGSVARPYEESIDRAPPPVTRAAEIAAAAGIAFGFTYWLIAGRTAGRWRERRTPPPLPPEARHQPEPVRPRGSGDPGAAS